MKRLNAWVEIDLGILMYGLNESRIASYSGVKKAVLPPFGKRGLSPTLKPFIVNFQRLSYLVSKKVRGDY
jgi:hypothetical protein